MAVPKSRPTLLRPMHAVHLGSYDALDRWLAAADLNPNDDLHSVLPDDQAMCEIFPAILPSIGNFPPVYVLSFMAFHPHAGTTHILRLALFAGYPDAPDAPLWASRLTPGRFVYFPELRAFVARLVAGLTDIPVKSILILSPRNVGLFAVPVAPVLRVPFRRDLRIFFNESGARRLSSLASTAVNGSPGFFKRSVKTIREVAEGPSTFHRPSRPVAILEELTVLYHWASGLVPVVTWTCSKIKVQAKPLVQLQIDSGNGINATEKATGIVQYYVKEKMSCGPRFYQADEDTGRHTLEVRGIDQRWNRLYVESKLEDFWRNLMRKNLHAHLMRAEEL
ncbi:hypothetical protein C8R44DRAFT_752370 [Mycena epipterygia]|nr:hypothetical protein C8R44DRAFT_752370 [Mycena epipterygia]